MSKGKTQTYYDNNPTAKAKKKMYDTKYNKKKSQVDKRVELNRENRRRGDYGNNDGKDLSHGKNGSLTKESASKNRARNGMKRGRPKTVRTDTKK